MLFCVFTVCFRFKIFLYNELIPLSNIFRSQNKFLNFKDFSLKFGIYFIFSFQTTKKRSISMTSSMVRIASLSLLICLFTLSVNTWQPEDTAASLHFMVFFSLEINFTVYNFSENLILRLIWFSWNSRNFDFAVNLISENLTRTLNSWGYNQYN